MWNNLEFFFAHTICWLAHCLEFSTRSFLARRLGGGRFALFFLFYVMPEMYVIAKTVDNRIYLRFLSYDMFRRACLMKKLAQIANQWRGVRESWGTDGNHLITLDISYPFFSRFSSTAWDSQTNSITNSVALSVRPGSSIKVVLVPASSMLKQSLYDRKQQKKGSEMWARWYVSETSDSRSKIQLKDKQAEKASK